MKPLDAFEKQQLRPVSDQSMDLNPAVRASKSGNSQIQPISRTTANHQYPKMAPMFTIPYPLHPGRGAHPNRASADGSGGRCSRRLPESLASAGPPTNPRPPGSAIGTKADRHVTDFRWLTDFAEEKSRVDRLTSPTSQTYSPVPYGKESMARAERPQEKDR